MGRSKRIPIRSQLNSTTSNSKSTKSFLTNDTYTALEQLIIKVSLENTPYLTSDGQGNLQINSDLRQALSKALMAGEKSVTAANPDKVRKDGIDTLLKESKGERSEINVLLARVSEYVDFLRPATSGAKKTDLMQYLQDVQPGSEPYKSLAYSVIRHIRSLREAHDSAKQEQSNIFSLKDGSDEAETRYITAQLAMLSAKLHLFWLTDTMKEGLRSRLEKIAELNAEYGGWLQDNADQHNPAWTGVLTKGPSGTGYLGKVMPGDSSFFAAKYTLATVQYRILCEWTQQDIIAQRLIVHGLLSAIDPKAGILTSRQAQSSTALLDILNTEIELLLRAVKKFAVQPQMKTSGGDEIDNPGIFGWEELQQLQDQIQDEEDRSNALERPDTLGAPSGSFLILSDRRPLTARFRRAMTKPRPSHPSLRYTGTSGDIESDDEQEEEELNPSERKDSLSGGDNQEALISVTDQEEWLEQGGYQRVKYRAGKTGEDQGTDQASSVTKPVTQARQGKKVETQGDRASVRSQRAVRRPVVRQGLASHSRLDQPLATLTGPATSQELQELEEYEGRECRTAWTKPMIWSRRPDSEVKWSDKRVEDGQDSATSFNSETPEDKVEVARELLEAVIHTDRDLNLILLDRPEDRVTGIRTMSFTGERLPSMNDSGGWTYPANELFFYEDGDHPHNDSDDDEGEYGGH